MKRNDLPHVFAILPACRLAAAVLFVIAPICVAEDVIVRADSTEVRGRILQASECVVRVEAQAVPPATGLTTLVLQPEQILEIRWGDDAAAVAEAEQLLLKKWQSVIDTPRSILNSGIIQSDLQTVVSRPAVLAHLERLLLNRDPRLSPPPASVEGGADGNGGGTPRKMPSRLRSMSEPLLEAMIGICWWNQEGLVLSMLSVDFPSSVRWKALRLLEQIATVRSIPTMATFLPNLDTEVGRIPSYLARLTADGHMEAVLAAVLPHLTSPIDKVRLRAWQSLRGGNLLEIEDLLLQAAIDPNLELRRFVARALAGSQEPAHGELLLRIVETDSDALAVQLALESIRDSSFTFLVPRLLELAEAESDPRRRQLLIDALQGSISLNAKHGERWDIWQLEWERKLKGVAESASTKLTPGELALMLDSADLGDRVAAIRGLADDRFRPYLSNDDILALISRSSEDYAIRSAAIDAMGMRAVAISSRSSGIMEELINVMERESDANLRKQVRVTLERLSHYNIDLGANPSLWRQFVELYVASDSQQLTTMITQILNNPETSSPLKIVALRMAANRKLSELTDSVLVFLMSPASDDALKLESIKTLGMTAGPADIDVLESLVEFLVNLKPFLRSAAHASLLKISGIPRIPPDPARWRTEIEKLSTPETPGGTRDQ